MFDTMKTAKIIRSARTARNMTQTDLADKMGVSYQAVSNWERGNSMPDISKLSELCHALDISLEELLGENSRESAVVETILDSGTQTLNIDDMAVIAPILPPETIREKAGKSEGMSIGELAAVAEFLDDEILGKLLSEMEDLSIGDLEMFAPYLEEDTLGSLAKGVKVTSVGEYGPLAPYLDEKYLDDLVMNTPVSSLSELEPLMPFLEEETLNRLAKKVIVSGIGELEPLAPYLEEDALDTLVKNADSLSGVSKLACYMGESTLSWVSERVDLKTVAELAPYLEEEALCQIAKRELAKGNFSCLETLYPFLSGDSMKEVMRSVTINKARENG